jgi:hypothetical protein
MTVTVMNFFIGEAGVNARRRADNGKFEGRLPDACGTIQWAAVYIVIQPIFCNFFRLGLFKLDLSWLLAR